MAMEEEYPAKESAAVEETEDRPASAADYLISARVLARKITDRGRRQAEEILRDANVRAEEILRDANARAGETVTRAEKQAEEILANAQRDAEALRAKTARELVPASPEDQEYTVRCVETCFEKLRRQHRDCWH